MEKLRRNESLTIVFDLRAIVPTLVMRKGVGTSLKSGATGCKVIIG